MGGSPKKALSDLVFGQPVRVQLQGRDVTAVGWARYWWPSPAAAPARCPFTLDAGHAQITRGLAWWCRAYAKKQSVVDAATYAHAEKQARAYRLGL